MPTIPNFTNEKARREDNRDGLNCVFSTTHPAPGKDRTNVYYHVPRA